MKIETHYTGNNRFASGSGDARVIMDATPDTGGAGVAPSPKSMLLYGLASCTGLDVVAILEKKKVSYDDFAIAVEAEQTNVHPKVFKSIRITYRFVGDEADRVHFDRAIELSKNQFCGVSAMLAKTADIDVVLEITPRAGQ